MTALGLTRHPIAPRLFGCAHCGRGDGWTESRSWSGVDRLTCWHCQKRTRLPAPYSLWQWRLIMLGAYQINVVTTRPLAVWMLWWGVLDLPALDVWKLCRRNIGTVCLSSRHGRATAAAKRLIPVSYTHLTL